MSEAPRERVKRLLPVLEAFANGAELEENIGGGWCGYNGTYIALCSGYDYRVKPREFWVCWNTENYPEDHDHTRWFESPKYDGCVSRWTNAIKVREVIE